MVGVCAGHLDEDCTLHRTRACPTSSLTEGVSRVYRKPPYPSRSACQTPAQPSEPWPRQVPVPRVRDRRPWPSACWPAPETLTRTTPLELTCPCRSTGPPPS